MTGATEIAIAARLIQIAVSGAALIGGLRCYLGARRDRARIAEDRLNGWRGYVAGFLVTAEAWRLVLAILLVLEGLGMLGWDLVGGRHVDLTVDPVISVGQAVVLLILVGRARQFRRRLVEHDNARGRR